MYLSLVSLAANITLGWTVALMRLLYVKYPVLTLVNEYRITAWLLSQAWALALGLSVMWYSSTTPTPKPSNTVCAGVGYEFAKLKLDFQGVKDGMGPRIGIIIVGILILCEFMFYLAIFIALKRNNKVMAAFLPEEKRQRRTRRNVIQLAGHCLKFGLKFVWLAIGGPTAFISKRYLLELQLVSWIVIYGTINLLQMVVSPILRRNFNS